MNLTICMSGKNAVGDGYRDIINSLPNKNEYIVVIPEGYEYDSFSADIFKTLQDNVSHNKNRISASIVFAYKIRKMIMEYDIKNIFIYFDNHWINSIIALFVFDLSVNIICWVHDPQLHDGANKKDKLIRYINKNILFKSSSDIIVSYKEAIMEMCVNYNVPHNKICSIKLPEMVSMEFARLVQMDIPKLYDFIFFGRLEKYKGLDILINIAKELHNRKFLVIGKGPYEKLLNEYCCVHDNLTFINEFVSEYQLAEYVCKSKFVLLPYISATGSQTVQIANYYGVPVIASGCGCFSEYISEYVNGINIDFSDKNRAFSKIKNALEFKWKEYEIKRYFRAHFSINKIVKKICRILEK